MKPSSLLRLSLLSTALLASASFTPPSPQQPPSPHLPPSLDNNHDLPPLPAQDTTFRTITLPKATTTLLPPSAPRPPLADATNRVNILADPAAPPAPAITPPPDAAAAITDDEGGDGWQTGIDANGKLFRFRQTTYYSCVTQKTASHCGWHRPILEVSGAAGDGDGRGMWGFGAKAAVAVGAAAGVVVVGW